LWSLWIAIGRHGIRRYWRVGAGLLVGTAAAIAPATIRNFVVSGDFVLISSNAGINLYIGNNPSADGGVTDDIRGVGRFRTCYDYPALVESLERKQGRALSASEVSAYFTREALRWIRENPLDFLRLTAWKAYLFWGPREIAHNKVVRAERRYSTVLNTLPGNFLFVLGACIVGVVLLAGDVKLSADTPSATAELLRRRREVSVLLIALALTFFLSILPFFVSARYRVPLIPFLLVFAAYGLCRLGRMVVTSGQRRTGMAVAAWIVLAALAGRPTPLKADEMAKWHADRGRAYMVLGQTGPAVEEFTQSVQLVGSNAGNRVSLGVALIREGRFEEAVRQLRAALAIEPANPAARRFLAEAQARAAASEGRDD
jgi:tetratricopeptide (TPR) repeat protein